MKHRATVAVVAVAAVVAVVSMFEPKRSNTERDARTHEPVERVAALDPRGIHVLVRDRSGQLARSFVEFGPYRRGERPGALLASQTCSYADDGETWLPRPTEPTLVRAYFNGHCELGPLLFGTSRIVLLDPAHLPEVLELEVHDDDTLARVQLGVPLESSLNMWAQIEDDLGLIVAEPRPDFARVISVSLPRGIYTAKIVSSDYKLLAQRDFTVGTDPMWITLDW
jgi:hypothetical protein